MEQVEQIQDEARGGREEELGAKGVFQYVFQMFHFCDDAIAGGAEMLPGSMTMRRREIQSVLDVQIDMSGLSVSQGNVGMETI